MYEVTKKKKIQQSTLLFMCSSGNSKSYLNLLLTIFRTHLFTFLYWHCDRVRIVS